MLWSRTEKIRQQWALKALPDHLNILQDLRTSRLSFYSSLQQEGMCHSVRAPPHLNPLPFLGLVDRAVVVEWLINCSAPGSAESGWIKLGRHA
jgi:hypothetical protein